VKRVFQIAAIAFFCLLTFVTRCHNLRDVFIRRHLYFVDADCYSRMTRVRMIAEHQGLIVKHHTFENWPQGVDTHTTAPLDYMILALGGIADCGLRIVDWKGQSVLRGQTLDLAGALVSPVIGLAGALFLAAWLWALRLRFWEMALLLYAVSPIIVHGTLLGRPDHQSLLMLTLMVAVGAELALAGWAAAQAPRGSKRLWGLVSGIAWAFSLWVSLYEPLVLLGATLVLWLAFDRRGFLARERLPGLAAFGVILAAALLIDGWRFEAPNPVIREYFPHWERAIGELSHLDLRSPLLYEWLGWLVVPAPVLMILMRQTDRRAVPFLILLIVLLGLTIWQVRWGYFLGVFFVMALPFQMPAWRRPWVAWLVSLVALWPLARSWDRELFPDETARERLTVQRAEQVRLRDVVLQMAGEGPFLAPWWISPAIAYWSGDPGVAGSSHESLPGIVDTARFFLATTPEEAAAILRKREVRWVLVDDADRMIGTSAVVLNIQPPERPLARVLAEDAGDAPVFLRERVTRRPSALRFGGALNFDAEAGHLDLEAAPDWLTFYRIYSVVDANLP
jgi:hypothetical protein